MQRVLVIGCSGSGKTTLAMQVADHLQLPYINLDEHYWQPGWTPTPMSQWHAISNELADRPAWIMDGTYGSTLQYRLQKADTVVYLDMSTWTCLYRVASRTVRYLGHTRPQMTDGCPERFDIDFLHYILSYRITRRKKHLAVIKRYSSVKSVHILRGPTAVKDWLASMVDE